MKSVILASFASALLFGTAMEAVSTPWIGAFGAPLEAFATGIGFLVLAAVLRRHLTPKRAKQSLAPRLSSLSPAAGKRSREAVA